MAVMTNGTFNTFTPALQGCTTRGTFGGRIHGKHSDGAGDPVFWMHHAEIDRIWAAWQATPSRPESPPRRRRGDHGSIHGPRLRSQPREDIRLCRASEAKVHRLDLAIGLTSGTQPTCKARGRRQR